MSVVTFPSALSPARFSFGPPARKELVFSSPFAGGQSVELGDPLWVASLSAPTLQQSRAGAWEAFILSLKGRANQLALWNLAKPAPLGTMRGTLTLSGAHAAGATTLSITGGAGQAGTTLNAGDLLGLGSGTSQQLVEILADATADGAGLISVSIHTGLRTAFSSGAAVTWDKPCALFRQVPSKGAWNYGRAKMVDGAMLDLIEDWRA